MKEETEEQYLKRIINAISSKDVKISLAGLFALKELAKQSNKKILIGLG